MRLSSEPSPPRPATIASHSAGHGDASSASDSLGTAFAGVFGLLLGLGLLKFGNPVVLDHLVDLPKTAEEWRVFSWPVRIGQFGLLAVSLIGLAFLSSLKNRSPRAPIPLLMLLGGWLLWQFVASLPSIDPPISRLILIHFVCLTACFGLGHWALSRVAEPRIFWMCLILAFLAVLVFGIEQRLGGLEATRKIILEGPNAAQLPPEYLARIRSNRVFATLVYPNALAGAILLLLPPTVLLAGRWGLRWGIPGQRTAGLIAGAVALLVLVWSGSKAGWLIAMGIALLMLFSAPIPLRLRLGIATAFAALGLVAFGVVFREKLAQGPTSAVARMDYWSAAWKGFAERPVLGQGPGAFKRVYARVKRPESEMAQLTHNDFLQQATDSGFPGFLSYSGFVLGSLGWLYRKRNETPPQARDPLVTAVGLGLLAWFTHGLVEFGLYIPATSWCAFALLGWALARVRS